MRLVSWAFVVCSVLGAIAMFLPSFELRLEGHAVARRTSLSLHQVTTSRDVVRRMLARYDRSSKKRIAEAVTAALMPHVHGKTNEYMDDATSAMTTADEVTDGDVKTVARILALVLVVFIALQAVAAGLIFGNLMTRDSRARIITALVLAVVIAAIAVAIHVACKEVVAEANDELGRTLLGLGAGAWVLPAAALGALGTAVAMVVLDVRAARDQRRR